MRATEEQDPDVQHDGEPHSPQCEVPRAQASGAAQDVWLAVELIVERVARLVLHAYALAERMDQQDSTPSRNERQARLGSCMEVGRRVLQAVARLDMAEPRVARPHDDVPGGRPRRPTRNGASVPTHRPPSGGSTEGSRQGHV